MLKTRSYDPNDRFWWRKKKKINVEPHNEVNNVLLIKKKLFYCVQRQRRCSQGGIGRRVLDHL